VRDVAPGTQAVELLLYDPGRLSGRVIGLDDEPVGTFRVAVRNRSTDQVTFHREFSGRDDGSWSLAPVAAGDLEVLGQDHYGHHAVASVQLEPNGNVSNIVLRLQQ
jgi:hypothetical protein